MNILEKVHGKAKVWEDMREQWRESQL